MKKILFALSQFFFLILFTSCSHSQCPIPKGMYKLEGLWEAKSNDGTVYELWKVNPDSTLQGKDFTIDSKGDTTIIEEFEVMCKDSSVYYVAKVPNQNGGQPVYFGLYSFNPMNFVFENKQHDFPQTISYSIKTWDLYSVILEGPDKDNKIKSIELRFTRKQ
jgi:hypothetical protein